MDLKIDVHSCLCSLSEFVINGISADEDDFVDNYDHSPETAEDYACGDMRADIKKATKEVLGKYDITRNEYQEIAEKVSGLVSFGCCGWCI